MFSACYLHEEESSFKIGVLNQAGGFQSGVNAVFIHGFEGPGGQFQGHEPFQFGNPETLGAQIGHKLTGGIAGNVGTDTALFLGFTAAVDGVAAGGLFTCDDARA